MGGRFLLCRKDAVWFQFPKTGRGCQIQRHHKVCGQTEYAWLQCTYLVWVQSFAGREQPKVLNLFQKRMHILKEKKNSTMSFKNTKFFFKKVMTGNDNPRSPVLISETNLPSLHSLEIRWSSNFPLTDRKKCEIFVSNVWAWLWLWLFWDHWSISSATSILINKSFPDLFLCQADPWLSAWTACALSLNYSPSPKECNGGKSIHNSPTFCLNSAYLPEDRVVSPAPA